MYDQYVTLGILAVAAMVLGALILYLNKVLGPKKWSLSKLETFETGNPPEGDARQRFSVRFYLVAILFILFDIEVVFLFPWATLYRQYIAAGMGLFMFLEMLVFVGVLVLGLVYVWRKGALEWD